MKIMKKSLFFYAIIAAMVLCVVSCDERAHAVKDTTNNDTMFQSATLQSLMIGNYYGYISVGDLRSHGNHGLGTFENIDGEMIILNDTVFQARFDGSVNVASDSTMVPFAVATHFDNDINFTVKNIPSLDSLLNILTAHINESGQNLIYAIKIDVKNCNVVKARSELPQQKPYKPLAEALKTDQREFTFNNVSGTIVGVYFPAYMSQLNAVGWHCHFITSDRTHGGHLFDISFSDTATVQLDPTPAFSLFMPEEKTFANTALDKDLSKEIEAVEK